MSSLGIFNKETKTYQKVAGDVGAAILDNEMSDTSENPVQNKVIKKYVDSKQVEVPIAGTGKAGIVKPADGLTVEEDGTLKVKLDGTTLTMDQVNNVIKLADTLKEKINGALPAANVVNNLTTTEAGFALDARQANPNLDGTLAKQISDLNGSLNQKINKIEFPVSSNGSVIQYLGVGLIVVKQGGVLGAAIYFINSTNYIFQYTKISDTLVGWNSISFSSISLKNTTFKVTWNGVNLESCLIPL